MLTRKIQPLTLKRLKINERCEGVYILPEEGIMFLNVCLHLSAAPLRFNFGSTCTMFVTPAAGGEQLAKSFYLECRRPEVTGLFKLHFGPQRETTHC